MNVLEERFLSLFSLRPGQGLRTVLVSAYLFLVIAAYLVMKPASSALFLKKIGAQNLPYVTILIAALLGLFVSFYIRAARRWKLSWLLGGSLVSCVLALLFFWILLGREIVWSYPLFSIWVGMYGVIATSQVWTLANELFTTREAKRVFGVVGAGGVLGGIVGAYSVRFLAGPVGTVNLLLIAAGLLTLALVLALVLVRLRLPVRGSREPTAARERLSDSLAYVAKSHHLRTIAGLVFVTALATKIVDWQFNTVAAAAFADKDALSGFFGTFYGTAGVLGLALQLFVTSRILQRFGLGTAVLVFPILLALGTGTLLLPVAGLAAAVLVRGSDAVLKHSLDRSSRELAFLPVPRHRKASAKSSIDMVVDRAGDGAAGFLQLGLIFAVTAFGGSLIQTVWVMAWVNLGIVALWVVMARRLRVSYVDELKRSIARGRLEVGTWYESLAGADTVVAVRQSLESGHRDQVIGALDVLVENPQWDCSESLAALAGSTDTEIRARALALLLSPEHPELPEGVARTFADEDRELLRECLDLQLSADPEERLRRAEAILDRAGGSSRGAWIALMVRRLGPEFFALTRNLMEELLRPDSPSETREVAATAIGMLPRRTEMHDMLLPLLDDADARVASAAARSGGAVGDPDLLRRIVPLVGRRGTRRAARQALQAGREASLPAIAKVLDAGADVPAYAVRLPRVLAGIPSANAFAMLLDLLSHAHPGVAGAAIRAIYRLRVRHPDREPVSENALLTPLGRQVRALERLAARRLHLEKTAAEGHPLDTLLASSIDRAEQGRWDMVFKLLALRLSPRRTLDCRRGILDGEVETRANAVEYLEATLPRPLWLALRPVLGYLPGGSSGDADALTPEAIETAVTDWSRGEDPWVAACSLYWLLERGGLKDRGWIDAFRRHPSSIVREVVEQTESGGPEMTVVEKVSLLRDVDPFRDVPPDQLAVIASLAREADSIAQADLYRQGDPPGDLYVILEGAVDVARDGRPIGRLEKGEAIGTWALLEEEPRAMEAKTATDCRFLKIDRGEFEEALDEHPEIARTLIRALLKRVRGLAGAHGAHGAQGATIR